MEDTNGVQSHYPLHGDLDHRASYIFRPVKSKSVPVRPSKRQRTAGSFRGHSGSDDPLPFVPLLNGLEDDKLVKKRYDSFQEFWRKQAKRLQEIFQDVDANVLKDVSTYVENISTDDCNDHIPAGLINLGSNMSSMGRLLNYLKRELHSRKIAKVVSLESGDAVNLKTVLKNIIRDATTEPDGESSSAAGNVRPETKYLPYDLDALHEHMQRQGMKKVVLAFQDSEAFDQSLLADLLSLLSSWLDRISFILLFGVATSIELFEGRLARATVNLLEGTRFDIRGCDNLIDRIFVTLQIQPDNTVWLGTQVSSLLLERSRDHFESPESFSYGMKYAYMTHIFANPLSVIGSGNCGIGLFQPELCEAIRNTYSFQRHVEKLLESRQVTLARRMLEDDKLLAEQAIRAVNQNRERTYKALETAKRISQLLEKMGSTRRWTISELVMQTLSGDLLESKELEELLKSIKKQSSDKMLELLPGLPRDAFGSFSTDIQKLLKRKKGDNPLRSEYDDRNQVHTTSVVGRRVQLNRETARLTPLEVRYTQLVDQFTATLKKYFEENLIQEELFLHEAFICDLKMPLKRVLAPRPRFTVERALSSPFDYLVPQSGLSRRALASSQPAISIAYQLYLESGGTINVYDWWSTFYSIIGGKDGELYEERQAMALFYRALTDLKMLGMIKSTKRKADHVAKNAWLGL